MTARIHAFDMPEVQVPPEWERIDFDGVVGVQMVIGAPDAGKSTFARYLYQKSSLSGQKTAFIDGDPGQSVLGPPTMETLIVGKIGDSGFPPREPAWRKFVGSTSPSGHLLPTVVGAGRLCEKARQAGATVIIYDTSGLVDPRLGGLALKHAKIDLLQPRRVYAIQQDKELEPLLGMLRKSQRCELVQLAPTEAVISRDMERRQIFRTEQFAAYFKEAIPQTFRWTQYGIYPAPRFALERLVALEDRDGFTLVLGIVVAINLDRREVTLLAPPVDLNKVRLLNLGDILINPQTFQDRRLD